LLPAVSVRQDHQIVQAVLTVVFRRIKAAEQRALLIEMHQLGLAVIDPGGTPDRIIQWIDSNAQHRKQAVTIRRNEIRELASSGNGQDLFQVHAAHIENILQGVVSQAFRDDVFLGGNECGLGHRDGRKITVDLFGKRLEVLGIMEPCKCRFADRVEAFFERHALLQIFHCGVRLFQQGVHGGDIKQHRAAIGSGGQKLFAGFKLGSQLFFVRNVLRDGQRRTKSGVKTGK